MQLGLFSAGLSILFMGYFALVNRPTSKVGWLPGLSPEIPEFIHNHSVEKMLDSVSRIRSSAPTKEKCYAPIVDPAADVSQQFNFGFLNFHGDTKKLNDALWEIRSEKLNPKDCVSLNGRKVLIGKKLQQLFQQGPVLAKLDLYSKDHKYAASLTLGEVRGDSAIFLNGKLVTYFSDPIKARFNSVPIAFEKSAGLEIWLNSTGRSPAGFLDPDSTQLLSSHLRERANRSEKFWPTLLFFVFAAAFFVFFVFDERYGNYFAVWGLVALTLGFQHALRLTAVCYHLQDDFFGFVHDFPLVFLSFAWGIVGLAQLQSNLRLPAGAIGFAFSFFVGTAGLVLEWAWSPLLVFGIALGRYFPMWKRKETESTAKPTQNRLWLGEVVFGGSMLWLFLSNLLSGNVHPGFLVPPFVLALALAAWTNWRAILHGRREQDQHLEILQSERDWVVVNQLVGESVQGLSRLGIVNQIYRNILLKTHKDYFSGLTRAQGNLSDGLVLSLTEPFSPKHGDPILEKLVRCYACYRDGANYLRDAYKTIHALIRFESAEIAAEMPEQSSGTDQLKLKTVVGSDLHFLAGGSERDLALPVTREMESLANGVGGFWLLPSLMRILTLAYPGIEKFFVRRTVGKLVSATNVEAVFQLNFRLEREFEIFLESSYGGALFLRKSKSGVVDYHTVRTEVENLVGRIEEVQDLPALMSLIPAVPPMKNFAEKNLVIRVFCEKATQLNVWSSPNDFQYLKQILTKWGIPAAGILKGIEIRDQVFEPDQILMQLQSESSAHRNSALRFLPLARTQKESRPFAMSEGEFVRRFFSIYFASPEKFNVESHLYVLDYLNESAPRSEACVEILMKIENKSITPAFISYFTGSGIPALQSLGNHYKSWMDPLGKKKGVA